MVIISYINKSVERIREATDYELKDGTYILKDAAGTEVGQAPSRQVLSIRKSNDADAVPYIVTGPKFGGFA
jgi:hypothetical protein